MGKRNRCRSSSRRRRWGLRCPCWCLEAERPAPLRARPRRGGAGAPPGVWEGGGGRRGRGDSAGERAWTRQPAESGARQSAAVARRRIRGPLGELSMKSARTRASVAFLAAGALAACLLATEHCMLLVSDSNYQVAPPAALTGCKLTSAMTLGCDVGQVCTFGELCEHLCGSDSDCQAN